ncbi:hypothetical protein CC1G_00738 [Coprinopsis cinerea okayama7|uniref:Uncharacterized protein n=1 Tax=Coprinopsis cinerea (strain Okayama-7 / 130 / ATCC MYA-4618 / FGSC 9003) TaxID=240176 RepID=A8N3I2_COPC7|nr:hypothetical protein CC1G_00738 [Coprinopsis cinerea okayama7\|eukprot:XP_001829559.2 hypothetical protein CC1G_00738 [Coprinopsis cinerea okayama7\
MDETPLDDAEFLQRAALDYGYIGVNLSLFGVERKRKGPFVIVIFTILFLFITMATIDSVSYKKFTMDTEMSLPKTSWWQVYDPSEVVGVVLYSLQAPTLGPPLPGASSRWFICGDPGRVRSSACDYGHSRMCATGLAAAQGWI